MRLHISIFLCALTIVFFDRTLYNNIRKKVTDV